jgi:hypothetical protein
MPLWGMVGAQVRQSHPAWRLLGRDSTTSKKDKLLLSRAGSWSDSLVRTASVDILADQLVGKRDYHKIYGLSFNSCVNTIQVLPKHAQQALAVQQLHRSETSQAQSGAAHSEVGHLDVSLLQPATTWLMCNHPSVIRDANKTRTCRFGKHEEKLQIRQGPFC